MARPCRSHNRNCSKYLMKELKGRCVKSSAPLMVLTIIILCNLKPIPDTIYGMKIPRVPWIFLQLLPQAADQTVSTSLGFFPSICFSIDHTANLRIGIHTSRMPGHDCENIKFPGRQQYLFLLHHNLTLEHIQKKKRISYLLRLHVDFHTLVKSADVWENEPGAFS